MKAVSQYDGILERILRDIASKDQRFAEFLFSGNLRYRYFTIKNSKDRPFWTTTIITQNGKRGYGSGIYKFIKSKNQFRLLKPVCHAKRKDAKARALKLYHQLEARGKQ